MANVMESKMSLFLAFLLAALLFPLHSFAEDSSPTLTLSQCVDTALANGDEIAIIGQNLGISKAQYEQAVAANSLALKGSAGYGVSEATGDNTLISSYASQTGVSVTNELPQSLQAALALSGPMTSVSLGGAYILPLLGTFTDSSLVSLGVSQTLWDGYPGGTAKATVEKSFLSLRVKQLTSDADRASLVYQVKQAFLTMLASQRTIAVKREILANQESSLREMEAAFKFQKANAVDLQTARINVKSAQVDLRDEQDALSTARISLANLMGVSIEREFTVEEIEESPALTISLQEAIAKGLEQRYELKKIALNLKATVIDLALIQGQKTPTVSVSGAAYLMFGNLAQTHAVAASATLSVGMPILDAGSAQHKVEENRCQSALYSRRESQTQRSIRLEIEKAYHSLKTQSEKLDLAKLQAENAEAYYQVEKTANQYGTVTNHDVLTASVDAANARVAYAKARSDVLLAVLALQNAMGY
jgi:outer membrane protein